MDKRIRKLDFIEVTTQAAGLILEFGIQLHLKCIWNWDSSQIQTFRWNLSPSGLTFALTAFLLVLSAHIWIKPRRANIYKTAVQTFSDMFNMLSFKGSLLNYQLTFPFQTHFIFIKNACKCFLMTTDQKMFI